MKNYFSRTRHRLDETEKIAIWNRIASVVSPAPRRGFRLRQGFAATVLVAASLVLVLKVFQGGPGTLAPTGQTIISKKSGPEESFHRDTGLEGKRSIQDFSDADREPAEKPASEPVLSTAQAADPAAPGDDIAVPPPGTARRVAAARDRSVPAGGEPVKPPGTLSEHDLEKRAPGESFGPALDGKSLASNLETSSAAQLAQEKPTLAEIQIDLGPANSYANVRLDLQRGRVPPADAVRIEEFVTNFDPGFGEPVEDGLRVFADGAPSPSTAGFYLIRVGLQSPSLPPKSPKVTLARNVKLSVTFDPANVVRHRLLGRELRDRDESGEKVVTPEIQSGGHLTALYEVQFSEAGQRDFDQTVAEEQDTIRLATVKIRFEPVSPGGELGPLREVHRQVTGEDLYRSFAEAPARLRLAAFVAEFAAILQKSGQVGWAPVAIPVSLAERLAEELGEDPAVVEFSQLVRKAARLVSQKE